MVEGVREVLGLSEARREMVIEGLVVSVFERVFEKVFVRVFESVTEGVTEDSGRLLGEIDDASFSVGAMKLNTVESEIVDIVRI